MAVKINILKKLYHFDLDIKFNMENDILAVIGESGSGKSMLLKSIAGIENPNNGNISVDDRVFYNKKDKINMPIKNRRVGYLFQNYALFPHLTVIENVMLAMNLNKVEKRKFAEKLLETFKVSHLSNFYPNQISGGEQQRVALARMISIDPSIILLDEPFSALDTNLKWEVEHDLMSFLKTYKRPSILVTHNMDEALRMSDKVLLLSKGKIIDFGEKKDILMNPKNLESAKLMGLKNFIEIDVKKDLIELKDFAISLAYNNRDEKKYSYLILNSKKFSFKRMDSCYEINAKFKYFTEDSQYYIFFFESILNNQKLITVEINKSQLKDLDIILSKIKDEKVSSIYYPKDGILLFE